MALVDVIDSLVGSTRFQANALAEPIARMVASVREFSRPPIPPSPVPLANSSYWQELLAQAPPPLGRAVTITATPTNLRFQFELLVADSHPLVSSGEIWRVEVYRAPFAQGVFGPIMIAGTDSLNPLERAASYQPPIVTLDPDGHSWRLRMEASAALRPARAADASDVRADMSIRADSPGQAAIVPEHDAVVVLLEGCVSPPWT
jgi:hypothetical protein